MKYLEVRRHTMRAKPGKHLSQAGVNLARKLGNSMGPFARVITSPSPRAYETAIAMGFAVDVQLDQLKHIDEETEREINWESGLEGFSKQFDEGGSIAKFARSQGKLWKSIAYSLPNDGRALVITHGGFIEAGAIACSPDKNLTSWGEFFNFCEGVLVEFEGDSCTGIQLLRLNTDFE